MCGDAIRYSGRGRIPATCSPAHRREARAKDARARRSGPATPPAAAPVLALDSTDTFRRIRARLAGGGLTSSSEVARLSLEERSALADLLNAESNPLTYAGDRLAGFAMPSDFNSSNPEEGTPSLGELGLTRVSVDRDGRTLWESDAALHRRKSYADQDVALIREECLREALRDAFADARSIGSNAPAAESFELAREAATRRAERILAMFAA
ncbi:hypothetical protein QM517_05285 [Rhodococcus sp. IEGM 1404]|nr:hypothetical protein [Microbacterium sp. IEGM 1404]